jgi:cysteinyl-tRNA synthetase
VADIGQDESEDVALAGADPDAAIRAKRDPRDFALWKGYKPGEPETMTWPSPWGRGRPGWHLECSAMSGKFLGAAFDIHGGGIDLKFPHHENELAQSRAAGRPFAHHWMHNNFLTDPTGEKMSKSLGNVLGVTEVVGRHDARSVRAFDAMTGDLVALAEFDAAALLPDKFVTGLDDDLGTPAAVAALHETVREGNKALDAGDKATVTTALTQVQNMLAILGLWQDDPIWGATAGDDWKPVVDELIDGLLAQRQQAKAAKDWAAADAIRDQLAAVGVTIEDTPSGPRWTR